MYSEKERETEKEDNMVEDTGELSWWAWNREWRRGGSFT